MIRQTGVSINFVSILHIKPEYDSPFVPPGQKLQEQSEIPFGMTTKKKMKTKSNKLIFSSVLVKYFRIFWATSFIIFLLRSSSTTQTAHEKFIDILFREFRQFIEKLQLNLHELWVSYVEPHHRLECFKLSVEIM